MKLTVLVIALLFLGVGTVAQVKKDSITAADFHVKKKHWNPFRVTKENAATCHTDDAFKRMGFYQRLKIQLDNGEISENEFQAGLTQLIVSGMHDYNRNRFSFRSFAIDPAGGVIFMLSGL